MRPSSFRSKTNFKERGCHFPALWIQSIRIFMNKTKFILTSVTLLHNSKNSPSAKITSNGIWTQIYYSWMLNIMTNDKCSALKRHWLGGFFVWQAKSHITDSIFKLTPPNSCFWFADLMEFDGFNKSMHDLGNDPDMLKYMANFLRFLVKMYSVEFYGILYNVINH